MQSKNHILLGSLGVLMLGGLILTVTQAFSGGDDIPTVYWELDQEEAVPDPEADPMTAELEGAGTMGRSAVDLAAEELRPGRDGGERVPITLRGRVIDPYSRPVPGAQVSLEIGRGGRRGGFDRRRIPDPVTTAGDGTFAFRGEAFRVLRVNLLVRHERFAPALVDRNLGEVEAEVDLGDVVISTGGGVLGRVTDLEGNGIAGASVNLMPMGSNPLRWIRDREELLPERQADQNGFYRLGLLPEGDYSIHARAPRHQRGNSRTLSVAEGRETEVPDIQLGPGYEIAGTVYGPGGEPVANAQVEARPQRGGTHRARTTREGAFLLEHLPGIAHDLRVEAEGLLTHSQQVDPTSVGSLTVQMRDGLRITGVVTDAVTGEPVTLFAAHARRVRDLPRPPDPGDPPGQGTEVQQLRRMLEDLRNQGLDEQEMRRRARGIQVQVERMVVEADRGRRARGDLVRSTRVSTNFSFRNRGGDAGKPEEHPGGTFALTGLQEGIYVVDVMSPRHVRHRTDELELRADSMTPHQEIALQRGFTVAGGIVDPDGRPIAGARVELRTVPEPNETRDGPPGMPRVFRGGGGTRLIDTRSGPQGAYRLEHAPPGRFQVRVTADSFAAATSEPFELQGDLTGLEIVLGNLGVLTGHVTGIPSGRNGETQVFAVKVENGTVSMRGGRPFVQVGADDRYRFDDLEPGSYLVRAFLGSPGDFFRREMSAMARGGATLAPDVQIVAGKTVELDLAVQIPEVGSLAGTVTHNLEPASAFRIQLRAVDSSEQGGGWASFGRNFNETVGSSGRYEFDDVPAGEYDLTVSPGRRGGEIHRERVFIAAFQEQVRDVAFQTGTIEGTVRDPEGGELEGNAMWLPGATEPPQDMGTWRRENRMFNTPVRGGGFRFEMLPPGAGLLIVNLRGRERSTATAFVGSSSVTPVEVQAGAPRENNSEEPRPGRTGR